jgi:thiamine biosynthesis lipoprotein
MDAATLPLILLWDWKVVHEHLPDASDVARVVSLSQWKDVQRKRGKIFLPREGMGLDFGGFGKEYAADRAMAVLHATGQRHGYVNLGGDIRVLGPRADGSAWRFGIQHPRQPEATIASVELAEGALATSGDYERYFDLDGQRYCHILNAHTGQPVRYWRSVSVLAPMCIAAGALSTIAMLKERAGESFLQERRVTFLAVDPNGLIVNAVGGSPSAKETP